MKKVLFATTALVASAGMASADVAITGLAEGGIFHNGNNAPANQAVQFFTDIDVTFTMTGETDGGIEFGASIDLDESDNNGAVGGRNPAGSSAFAQNLQGGEEIFVRSAWGNLTMGDTDGALDFVLQEVALGPASLADDETAHAGYNGNAGGDGRNDGQIARYDYTFGDFSFALSAEIDDDGNNGGAAPWLGMTGGTIWGVGGSYDYDMGGATIGFGVGYQAANLASLWGASLDATLDNGFSAGVSFMRQDERLNQTATGDWTHWGIGAAYTMDAISFGVNYGNYSIQRQTDVSGLGLSAEYDLGGGMTLNAGYGYSFCNTTGVLGACGGSNGANFGTMSLGARMAF